MEPMPRFCGPAEEFAHASHRTRAVERWQHGREVHALDQVAEEVPVAMVYNGISHAVMLATPAGLEAFGLGFSLAEGILKHKRELYDTEIVQRRDGIELHMTIAQERFVELKSRRRNLAGRTGCGLCGTESLQQVMRPTAPVESGLSLHPHAVHAALAGLPGYQSLQALTGAAHAAAWVSPAGVILHCEEDIGRHNALDKLIGTLAHHDADIRDGFVIVTSRASYEMVQKCATRGIAVLIAVSAPTSFAIDLAQQSGMTLAGFARGGSHVVYTHSHRLIEPQEKQ
ncbi:formate dehydrogenase accessory sulfurtransferase FdhD [Methylobacillus sp. MM3]|uniref:formate dehydrogenase accessory sulfurtransferase FdhD n=1 Tax=Methylobacillus sp. MM3 TaxID=1848039 RepID=UPI0009ED18D2|nr:formate dehydrogenase accessory sulfurtransferase FdhD [Methylobacillus sp. MM3]